MYSAVGSFLMPIITVPEIVWLTPLHVRDHPTWTRQPDGSELLVEDTLEYWAEGIDTLAPVQREAIVSLDPGTVRIEPRRLRPYQEECVQAVFRAWEDGKKAPMIVMGTGSGKTAVAAEITRRLRAQHPGHRFRVWFLAHREELIDQTYRLMKLVAPEATCGIVQGTRDDVGKFVTIGSVDTLANVRRFERATAGTNVQLTALTARPPDVVIWDECVPAGTMIGDREVERVAVGDIVPSYDEATGCAVHRRVVRVMKRSAPSQLFSISSRSLTLTCTGEHPILTRRGWVPASTVTTEDEVLTDANENMCSLSDSQDNGVDLRAMSGDWEGGATPEIGLARPLRGVRGGDRAVPQEGGRGERAADPAGAGPQEGELLAWSRVDCVAIHERGGDEQCGDVCPDGFVYNLEVEGTHTYIANGVVVHNCHHAASNTWKKLAAQIRAANPDSLFLGMTATPGRTDGTALDAVFDAIAYERNAFQLIEDGYLVPPVGFRVDLNIDLDLIPTDDGEFKKAPLSKVMNQPAIRQAVVEGYQRYGDARKMLAFCVDVAHAKDLADQFRQNGIQARHVDGTMKKGDRAAALQAFAEGKTRILTSCDVLTEGYDDPSAQGVIFARPTNSQLVYVQALGRALRLHPSKRDALVIDCVGNSQKHKIAQLASLAGLQEVGAPMGKGKRPGEAPEIGEAEVGGLNAHRIDFRIIRQRASKWSWRETRFGWTVSIPRVGYFLLSWASTDRRRADVKFHDMRDGKRDAPPVILSTGMDFEMAYGLVEQEIERLFSARTSRARIKDKEGAALGSARDILDEGVSGELFSPEELMRNDAEWRDKPTSERQRAALIDIGVKTESVPGTAGEASDLFSVMTIERNAKMREPATLKQRQFVVRAKLATHAEAEAMTKKQAAGLIIKFLAEKKAAKDADERFADGDERELEDPNE